MAFLKAIVSHRFHVLDILEFFQKNVLHQFFCVCQAQEKTDKQFKVKSLLFEDFVKKSVEQIYISKVIIMRLLAQSISCLFQ